MARIIEGIKEVKTLLYAHNADVDAGEVIVVNNMVLIALSAALANVVAVYAFSCRAAFPLSGSEALASAVPVYWDESGEVITATAAGNTFAGTSIEAAAEAVEEAVVDLFPGIPAVLASGAVGLVNLGDPVLRLLPLTVADPGDAGAIPVAASGVCALETLGAETRTLAAPTFEGQRLTVCFDVDGGDCVLTATPAIDQTGNNTVTFANEGEFLELVAVYKDGALVWRIAGSDIAAALATV